MEVYFPLSKWGQHGWLLLPSRPAWVPALQGTLDGMAKGRISSLHQTPLIRMAQLRRVGNGGEQGLTSAGTPADTGTSSVSWKDLKCTFWWQVPSSTFRINAVFNEKVIETFSNYYSQKLQDLGRDTLGRWRYGLLLGTPPGHLISRSSYWPLSRKKSRSSFCEADKLTLVPKGTCHQNQLDCSFGNSGRDWSGCLWKLLSSMPGIYRVFTSDDKALWTFNSFFSRLSPRKQVRDWKLMK